MLTYFSEYFKFASGNLSRKINVRRFTYTMELCIWNKGPNIFSKKSRLPSSKINNRL